jgi:membrane-associated phospholipid phosphatase
MTARPVRIEPSGDRTLLRRLTAGGTTRKARVVRQLVPVADDLKPWLAATPLLILRRRGPRAVLSGWLAVALAAALSAAAKHAIQRARPDAMLLQDRVVAGDEPSTPSFPSTHTSQAVAFTGATIAVRPDTAWLLGPLAIFVAWSRLAGGRHYPSDVAAGALVGAVAAAAVTGVRRVRRR